MRTSAFLARGPRYIWEYSRWRAGRLLATFQGGSSWPLPAELGAAIKPSSALPGQDGVARPLCDASRRDAIVRAVPEEQRLRTIAEADAACDRRFRYRGQEVRFEGPVDWQHRPGGNLDWTWDLNRHHFFPVLGRAYWYTGDERYARAFLELLADWMDANPPQIQSPSWRSIFEVGVRISNWAWAHAHFAASPNLLASQHELFLRGLLGHARFLKKHLERHAWNNHLLLEARALAMVGLLYPGLPGAGEWERDGLKTLHRELERQVLPDGVHSERSSLYHAIVASELLEHLVVLRLAGRDERSSDYCTALVRLVGLCIFQAAITRADGSRPLLGDASNGDRHERYDAPLGARVLLSAPGIDAPARADENLLWLFASLGLEGGLLEACRNAAPRRTRHSRAFPNGGYYVLEAETPGAVPLHCVFDCGPFGDSVVPGHGHADALSIDIAVGGSHVLVDPGMYSAHLGERWRNFFRGTSAHNTLLVDGTDQSLLQGLRGVYRPAAARPIEWTSCGSLDVAAGYHTGYRRLREPVVHRREIVFRKPRWWLVVDRLEGRGRHEARALFHFHPQAVAMRNAATGTLECRMPDGSGLAILPLDRDALDAALLPGGFEGDAAAAPQGWVAFQSGVKEPAPVVWLQREGDAPLHLATVLVPLLDRADVPPELDTLTIAPEGGAKETPTAGVLRHRDGTREDFFCRRLQPRAGSVLAARSLLPAGDLESDGAFACVSSNSGATLESAALFHGTEIRWRGEAALRLDAGGLPGHVTIDKADERLDVAHQGPALPGAFLELRKAAWPDVRIVVNGIAPRVVPDGGLLRVILGG